MSTEEKVLNSSRVVAMVGLSSKPGQPSYRVASYLKEQGYKIIPVNPAEKEILGEPCYPDLASIPESVDVVDIFRRSDEVLPIVEEAIKIGAKVVWMQEGVVNEEAAARAREAGLEVVMDKCMRKEHGKLKKRAHHALDCIGLYCPATVLNTRQEIDKLAIGEILKVLVDDPAAEEDLKAWAKRTGQKILEIEKTNESMRFLIQKTK
jgi:predicted CoA-binding protein/TusA-related sulfurtransferase